MTTLQKRILLSAALASLAALGAALLLGSSLTAPVPSSVGAAPENLSADKVEFASASGNQIHAWWIPGQTHRATIVLAHSLRANRREMLGRARFLHAAGYSLLLFDAQAHGESSGEQITFGVLEAFDAHAAVEYARTRSPDARIGYLGSSLGGAAALLGSEALPVDALILEAVYPTIREAAHNRIEMRLGALADLLTPLLLLQVEPRLGISPAEIAPIDSIAKVEAPLLLIAGELDQHTTLEQSKRLFAAAPEPKELWVVSRARHGNFHRASQPEYERRVLEFLQRSGL